MIKSVRRLLCQSIKFISQHVAQKRPRDRQADWESKWARTDFWPAWLVEDVPNELKEAVDQQWFSPAGSLLDIGCGNGQWANWLAQQGFVVVGIDFAPSAMRRARAAYPENERLQFRTMDICRATPDHAFMALFDRGCFHLIPEQQRPLYIQNVAQAAAPNAHFLLLHRSWGSRHISESPDELEKRNQYIIDQIEQDFQPMFEIVRTKPIVYRPPDTPGIAVWMVRRCVSRAI